MTSSEAFVILSKVKTKSSLKQVLDSRNDWPASITNRKKKILNLTVETFVEEARLDSLLDSNRSDATSVSTEQVALEAAKIADDARVDRKGIDKKSNIAEKGLKPLQNFIENLFKIRPKVNSRSPGGDPRISGTGAGSVIDILVKTFISIIAVGLIVLIVILVSSAIKSLRKVDEAVVEGDLMTVEEAAIPLDEWLRRGQVLIENGEYRPAIRSFYLAILLTMGEAGLIKVVRNQTNWEHFRRYQTSAFKFDQFSFHGETTTFDEVWYGSKTPTLELALQMQSSYSMLLSLIQERKKG